MLVWANIICCIAKSNCNLKTSTARALNEIFGSNEAK